MSKSRDAEIIRECGDDADKWAEAFMDVMREGMRPDRATMLGWFANAIETAITERAARRSQLSGSEAAYGLAAWLTTRRQTTHLGASENCGGVAELVEMFVKTNELDAPRDRWSGWLKHPVEKQTKCEAVSTSTARCDKDVGHDGLHSGVLMSASTHQVEWATVAMPPCPMLLDIELRSTLDAKSGALYIEQRIDGRLTPGRCVESGCEFEHGHESPHGVVIKDWPVASSELKRSGETKGFESPLSMSPRSVRQEALGLLRAMTVGNPDVIIVAKNRLRDALERTGLVED